MAAGATDEFEAAAAKSREILAKSQRRWGIMSGENGGQVCGAQGMGGSSWHMASVARRSAAHNGSSGRQRQTAARSGGPARKRTQFLHQQAVELQNGESRTTQLHVQV